MRVRSFVGLLLAIALGVYAVVLHTSNRELFQRALSPRPGDLDSALGRAAGDLPRRLPAHRNHARRRHAAPRPRGARDAGASARTRASTRRCRRAVDFQADGQGARRRAELESLPRRQAGRLRRRSCATARCCGSWAGTAEAIEVHRRAAATYPRSVGLLYQLAADYRRSRRGARSRREIESRIVRDFPGYGLEVLRGRRAAALEPRDFGAARRSSTSAITELLDESGDSAGAGARVERWPRGSSTSRACRLLEDRPRRSRRRRSSADLLAREPRFIPARIMLGEAELLEDREEVAVAAWRDGYEETGSPVFLQRIEDYFIEQEEPMRAIETLRALIAAGRQRPAAALLSRPALLPARDARRGDEAARRRSKSASSPRRPTISCSAAFTTAAATCARAVESYGACLRQLDSGSAEYVCRRLPRSATATGATPARAAARGTRSSSTSKRSACRRKQLGVLEVPVWGVVGGLGRDLSLGRGSAPLRLRRAEAREK